MSTINMFSMDNNNNYSGSNNESGNNTSSNARDNFNAFFDSMGGNINNSSNNSNAFVNGQPSNMVMGSPYEQSINLSNNNNGQIAKNISPSQYNFTPATPQQILMFNNNNDNNSNTIKSTPGSTNINIQPQQILSKQVSPVLSNTSPLVRTINTNNSKDNKNLSKVGSSPNIQNVSVVSNNNNNNNGNNNNSNTTNASNNNAFPDRNSMMTNLQQQRLMELQRQQKLQRSMNSPVANNIMPYNRDDTNAINNSPMPTTSSLNTPSSNYNNTNIMPINQSPNLTPQQRQHLLQLQQQKNILQSLSPSLQQRISIEVNNKQYELFMKSLIENSKRRNSPLQSIPEIQNKKVNLFYLSLMVTKNGGYEEVTRKQLWNQIANKLRIVDPQQLQIVYYNILLEYEKYMNTDEGKKESLAKKNFLQQFLHELLRKIQLENAQQQQQQQKMTSNQFNDINMQQNKIQNFTNSNQNASFNNNTINSSIISGVGSPNVMPTTMNPANMSTNPLVSNSYNVTASNLMSVNPNPQMAQPPISTNSAPEIANNSTTNKKGPKKPRKPRQKKKTKKELELERKQREEQELEKRKLLEAQTLQRKLMLEQKIKQRYETELAKLPKVYKRTFIRNYQPRERKIDHINGYDINYISQIGEKIDAHKPYFLSAPELGTANLHAISMSLQCTNLGEITTALNTLLVISADAQLKISLNQCPSLLNSLTKLAIKLLGDLTHTNESAERKILRDKRLSFMSDYADDYDVKGYLNNTSTSFSDGTRRIDDVFNKYVKSSNVNLTYSDSDKVIVVDSLTGCDIEQIDVTERTMNIEVPSNSEVDAVILKKKNNISNKVPHKWTSFTQQIRSQYEVEKTSLFVPSYMEALKDIKCEIDSPFSKIHTRGAENISVLILDQLSTISMILRNISFSDINSIVMSQNFFLKRYFNDLSWLLFIDHEKFKFHRKLLNFKKDILITLSNISHHLKIESYSFTVTLVLLILSFRISKYNKGEMNELTFDEYPLKMSSYQNYGVDTLAKLLSLTYPNRQYLETVLLNKFNDENITINDDVKMAKKLVLKYNEKGDLYQDLICFLFSVIPFQQLREDPSLLEEVSPVISQALTSLYYLLLSRTEKKNNNRSKIGNVLLEWLTGDESLGIKFRELYELYQNFSRKKLENRSFYNNLSCKIIRLLRLLITESALDSASCQKIAESPNILPSETDLLKHMLDPSGNAAFANELKLLLNLRNKILGKL